MEMADMAYEGLYSTSVGPKSLIKCKLMLPLYDILIVNVATFLHYCLLGFKWVLEAMEQLLEYMKTCFLHYTTMQMK